jgi:hypothetical protein
MGKPAARTGDMHNFPIQIHEVPPVTYMVGAVSTLITTFNDAGSGGTHF